MMHARLYFGGLVCVLSLAVGAVNDAGAATTGTLSISDDLATTLRERLADYQPWIDSLRKRAGTEMEKLNKWEYRVVRANGSDPVNLTEILNRWGDDGWECFHVVSGAPGPPTGMPAEHLLFFRKRPKSWFTQMPVRELLKMFWFMMSDTGEGTQP